MLRNEQVVEWDGQNLASRFGVSNSERAILVPMVIKDKVAAAVYVDAVADDASKFDSDAIEMRSGSQWVQVDLGAPHLIYAIALWHDHRYIQIARDVIVQVSDDPEFKTGVTTLYNNDFDDSSKQGPGKDKEYFETKWGKIIDAKGVKARYIRGYSKGTSLTALNCWQEIEVYGVPAP